MHPCLRVLEIIDHIFYEVEYGQKGIRVTRDAQLFALALTCRLFRDLALAHLWNSLDSITPIIKCAGRDLWEKGRDSESDQRNWQWRREISPPDVAVMAKYGSLVRHFDDAYRNVMPTDVWSVLHRAFAGAKLFPNLRSLELSEGDVLDFASLIGTKYLTSFILDSSFPPQHSSFLDFSAQCSALKLVDLAGFEEDDLQTVATAMSNWPNLTSLHLDQANLEIIRALSHCSSSLETLMVDDFAASEAVSGELFPTTIADAPKFPVLRSIHATFGYIPSAAQFVDFFPATSNIQRWGITTDNEMFETSDEKDWLKLFYSLKKYAHSLEYLEIEECVDDDPLVVNADAPPLSGASLFALATYLPKLVDVAITKVGGYRIVDEDVEKITEALPLLQRFSLYDSSERQQPSDGVTIACLASFARNCPSLSHLCVQFDARADKIPEQSKACVGSKLTDLDVNRSPIDDAELVANYLLRTFPNLERIAWFRWNGDEPRWKGDVLWCKVSSIIAKKYQVFDGPSVDHD